MSSRKVLNTDFGTQALHGRCTRSTSRAFSPGTYWWHETDPSHWCGSGSQSGGSGECLGVLEETCYLKGPGISIHRGYIPLFLSLKFCKASNCTTGLFVVLLFLWGCFMRVAGIQRGKMSSFFAFICFQLGELLWFYRVYIFTFIYLHLKYTIS